MAEHATETETGTEAAEQHSTAWEQVPVVAARRLPKHRR